MKENEWITKEIPNKINYYLIGEGKPLLLLHGFAEDATIWTNQIKFLSSRHKLILPDLPGSGISKEYLPALSTTIEDFAMLINEIIMAEKIEQFSFLGHSMGGYVALAYAELFPEMLNGFGLIHSTAYADSAEKKEIRTRSIEFIEKHGSLPFLETMIPGLYSDPFIREHKDVIQNHISMANSFNLHVFAAYYEMMKNRPDRRLVLESFTKPILFIIGTEDKAVFLKDSLEQSHLPVDPHIEILDGVGHMGMIEVPDKVNKALENFMMLM